MTRAPQRGDRVIVREHEGIVESVLPSGRVRLDGPAHEWELVRGEYVSVIKAEPQIGDVISSRDALNLPTFSVVVLLINGLPYMVDRHFGASSFAPHLACGGVALEEGHNYQCRILHIGSNR